MIGMEEITRPTSCAPTEEPKAAEANKTKGMKRFIKSPITKNMFSQRFGEPDG
jgi:hypothetical protein